MTGCWLLTGGLLAQGAGPIPSAPQLPAPTIVLKVTPVLEGKPNVSFDSASLESDLTSYLQIHHIRVTSSAGAKTDPSGFSLEIYPRIEKDPAHIFIIEILGTLTRLSPPSGLPSDAKHDWSGTYAMAQSSSDGLEAQARHMMLVMASMLLDESKAADVPPPPPPFPSPAKAAAGGEPPPPDSQIPLFSFRQIRVDHQPPSPPYPPMAKARGIQGDVLVRIIVDPDGMPVRAFALGGQPELKPAALRYALRWRFKPALLNGKPIWAMFNLNMPFRL